MPAAIAVAQPEIRLVSLGQFEAPPDAAGDYDRVMIAPAPERRDPCAQLRAPQQ